MNKFIKSWVRDCQYTGKACPGTFLMLLGHIALGVTFGIVFNAWAAMYYVYEYRGREDE